MHTDVYEVSVGIINKIRNDRTATSDAIMNACDQIYTTCSRKHEISDVLWSVSDAYTFKSVICSADYLYKFHVFALALNTFSYVTKNRQHLLKLIYEHALKHASIDKWPDLAQEYAERGMKGHHWTDAEDADDRGVVRQIKYLSTVQDGVRFATVYVTTWRLIFGCNDLKECLKQLVGNIGDGFIGNAFQRSLIKNQGIGNSSNYHSWKDDEQTEFDRVRWGVVERTFLDENGTEHYTTLLRMQIPVIE